MIAEISSTQLGLIALGILVGVLAEVRIRYLRRTAPLEPSARRLVMRRAVLEASSALYAWLAMYAWLRLDGLVLIDLVGVLFVPLAVWAWVRYFVGFMDPPREAAQTVPDGSSARRDTIIGVLFVGLLLIPLIALTLWTLAR